MNLQEAVANRRSVRAFEDRAVPLDSVRKAIELAVQAPAPHHSSPWRFALLEDADHKAAFSAAMGESWRKDLTTDGLDPQKIQGILDRSHALLTSTPLLVVCCADMRKSHDYTDERRRRAEWSLFAHSVGACLQTFMLSLTEDGIASCWISAPVFCGTTVKQHMGLDATVEPHALVLVGYAAGTYSPRARPPADASGYVVGPVTLPDRE